MLAPIFYNAEDTEEKSDDGEEESDNPETVPQLFHDYLPVVLIYHRQEDIA